MITHKGNVTLTNRPGAREALVEQFMNGSKAWLGFRAVAERSHYNDGDAMHNMHTAMIGINAVLDVAIDLELVKEV